MATAQSFAASSGSPYRFAGWAAIVSGIIGIVAYGFLWAFLVKRISGASEQICIPLIRTHDAGVILQSLFMIPVALALYRIGRQHSPGVSRGTVVVGVVALSLIVFCLLLIFINVLADEIYMIPQGVLGLWLILVSRSGSTVLSRSLRVLGTVVGIGLVLVAAFPIGSAIFVAPRIGPIPFDYQPPKGTETADGILHIVLLIGSLMGVATYPIWATLVGRRLLRQRSS